MAFSTGTPNRQRGNLLFTGNGEAMIKNLIDHCPDRFRPSMCPATEVAFNKALVTEKPHAVVVCLLDETREMLRMYYALESDPQWLDLPVAVIGKEEDCAQFRRKVVVKNQAVFVRPFDQALLWETLDRFVKESMEREAAAPLLEQQEESRIERLEEQMKQQQAEAAAKAMIRRVERMNMDSGRKSILIVDDDVRMLNVLKAYLEDLYEVTVVPSGKLALKFLSKKSADLVLLDYMMPELDGPEVLRQIREGGNQPNIPVVFLTGVSDKEQVMRGLEFRPNGYLLKPVTRETLLEKATEILLGL